MRELAAFFAFAAFVGLLVWIAVLVCAENRPQGYAMHVTKASAPANEVPWRLLAPCTPNRTNVPRYKERTA